MIKNWKKVAYTDVKTRSSSLGRNGEIITRGVEVFANSAGALTISPITSRGRVGRCAIEIPKKDVKAVVEALSELAKLKK